MKIDGASLIGLSKVKQFWCGVKAKPQALGGNVNQNMTKNDFYAVNAL